MNQMYGTVTSLHIEPSSRCNASCPVCARNSRGGAVLPDLELTELSLADIKQMIPVELIAQITNITFCGNIGDPGMTTELLQILEYFREHSPNIQLRVSTNGGMRNAEFWTAMGNFFKINQTGYSGVVFGVDGLEDTNHIYRRGVIWEKLIRNMRAYSATGATARWEWLLFDHNKHQIEEAQKLAKELKFELIFKNPIGFATDNNTFKPIAVYNKIGEYEYAIWPADHVGEKVTPDVAHIIDFPTMYKQHKIHKTVPMITEFSRSLENNTIKCKSIAKLNQGEVYISSTGYMLPCCYLGNILGTPGGTYSRYQFDNLIRNYGMEKFNLRKQSMAEILRGPEFSKFFIDGWTADTIKNGKLLFCLETCGQTELNVFDKLYKHDLNSNSIIELKKHQTETDFFLGARVPDSTK
jgi:MoaA/NifB/PqqE/SkfB family radical SAM enzyme